MIGWMVEAWLASAVLIALVLALRVPVRRWFGARIAYALWALPALRLLLPPVPESWRHHAVATPIAHVGKAMTVMIVPAVEPLAVAAPPASSVPWGAALLSAWAIGVVALLAWHLVRHRRFCRQVIADAVAQEVLAGGVRLVRSKVAGPLAFGLARRYVVVPRDFDDRYEADERDIAIAHELGHHLRGDLWANWAALALLALHWPNPLAWLAFRAFRADQEMANDASLIAARGAKLRHAYARAIVKAAHGGAIRSACHLHTIEDIKGRLRMLANVTSRRRSRAGAIAVTFATVAALGLTASGGNAAKAVTASVHRATGIDLAALKVAPAIAATPVVPPASVQPVREGNVQLVPLTPLTPTTAVAPLAAVTATTPVTPAPPMPPVDGRAIQASVDAAMSHVPQVTSENCGRGDPRQMVVHAEAGGVNRIVICTDRIANAAAAGAAAGARSGDIERNAYRSALAGLEGARRDMAADARLTGEARADALASMDESIADMQGELAGVPDDDD